MMQSIEHIVWDKITHAHGNASDLPYKLHALRSPLKHEREEALSWCYEALWHHGVVFEASAASIPLLLEMLQDPGVEDKEELLLLLAHLATGETCPNAYEIPQHRRMNLVLPGSEEAPPLETAWLQRTHEEARKGIDLYTRCLHAPQAALRVNAAFLLACFPLEGKRIQQALLRRLDIEEDPCVLASILMSFGVLELEDHLIEPLLEGYLDSAFPALVRLAAAVSLTRQNPQHPSRNALRILMHALTISEVSDLYATLPWAEFDTAGDISRLLCRLGRGVPEFVIPRLLDLLPIVDPYSAVHMTYTLLDLSGLESPAEASRLDTTQREILQALVETKHLWTLSHEIAATLDLFGLPDNRGALLAFLQAPAHLQIAS
ncbi:MAG: hypothetical protein H6728_12685 [Myxococcales bacterium]|nr:hypothetical protein [Myxococcales bacterium]MCB9643924.1 hypothetical protein [Myxococcales bacterium]